MNSHVATCDFVEQYCQSTHLFVETLTQCSLTKLLNAKACNLLNFDQNWKINNYVFFCNTILICTKQQGSFIVIGSACLHDSSKNIYLNLTKYHGKHPKLAKIAFFGPMSGQFISGYRAYYEIRPSYYPSPTFKLLVYWPLCTWMTRITKKSE